VHTKAENGRMGSHFSRRQSEHGKGIPPYEVGNRENAQGALSTATDYHPNLSHRNGCELNAHMSYTNYLLHICPQHLLPNYPPYYFRFNNKLTFNFGNPIDISDVMKNIFDNDVDDVTARRIITDKLQDELNILRAETEKLHNES
jgi:hypothetical protein